VPRNPGEKSGNKKNYGFFRAIPTPIASAPNTGRTLSGVCVAVGAGDRVVVRISHQNARTSGQFSSHPPGHDVSEKMYHCFPSNQDVINYLF